MGRQKKPKVNGKHEAHASRLDKMRDRRWRLNNLYKIKNADGEVIPFVMNEEQADFFDKQHYLNIILKARQLGFTTFIQLEILDFCFFNSNMSGGVVAHSKQDAQRFFEEKIKFAYEQLHPDIKQCNPLISDSKQELRFKNGSSIFVGTSLRGGTLQYLHISEYGKLCARFPDKAEEVKTGALNTVAPGNLVWIESTAEGQSGDFYDKCQMSMRRKRMKEPLTPMDYKFHFYPWWQNDRYTLDARGKTFTGEENKYFEKLAQEQKIYLTPAQKHWYLKKEEEQGEHMKREYPSFPEEAFEVAIEGAYYSTELAKIEAGGQITSVPYNPGWVVNTYWDLGFHDYMTIWFVQRIGRENRVIDYYENSGEGLAHYKRVLDKKGYIYGTHTGPHDIEVHELSGEGLTRKQHAAQLGIKFEVAPKIPVMDGINATRNILSTCWFDKSRCAIGLQRLRQYRKEWNERTGCWSDRPRHDENSHGADGFRVFSTSIGLEEDKQQQAGLSDHVRENSQGMPVQHGEQEYESIF